MASGSTPAAVETRSMRGPRGRKMWRPKKYHLLDRILADATGVAAGDGEGGALDGRTWVRAAEMATRCFALHSPEAAIRPVRKRARLSAL